MKYSFTLIYIFIFSSLLAQKCTPSVSAITADINLFAVDDIGQYVEVNRIEHDDCPLLNVRLFPNPTMDYFEVSGIDGIGWIVNNMGQWIREVDVSQMVNVSDLASGVYILRGQNWFLKFVKQ